MMAHDESNNRPDVIGRLAGGDVLPALEPELVVLDAQLNELAAVEALSAPAELTGRVFEASRSGIIRAPRRGVVARIGPGISIRSGLLTPLRAAAGVALAVSVALALVAGHGRTSVNSGGVTVQSAALENDVNEWLALSNGMMGDLAVQIDGLDADSASLRDQLSGGLPVSDLFLDEGAF